MAWQYVYINDKRAGSYQARMCGSRRRRRHRHPELSPSTAISIVPSDSAPRESALRRSASFLFDPPVG